MNLSEQGIKNLKRKLEAEANIGLDMSPGNQLCKEALDYIEELEQNLIKSNKRRYIFC